MRVGFSIFSVAFVLLGLLGCTSIPGGGTISEPSGQGPFPAIIVFHTSGGLSNYEKIYARNLSEQGYVVLTVDYFGGTGTNTTDGYEYLISLPNVDPDKIGLVGFSRGGRAALWFASRLSLMDSEHQISGVVSYYIGNSIVPWIKGTKHPPILFLHGEEDQMVQPIEITNYCEIQRENGTICDYYIYEGVRHAFDHKSSYGGDNSFAADDARKRAMMFLNEYVKRNKE